MLVFLTVFVVACGVFGFTLAQFRPPFESFRLYLTGVAGSALLTAMFVTAHVLPRIGHAKHGGPQRMIWLRGVISSRPARLLGRVVLVLLGAVEAIMGAGAVAIGIYAAVSGEVLIGIPVALIGASMLYTVVRWRWWLSWDD